MGEVLYRKVGKKYLPVNDPCATDGLWEGTWLVVVSPGCKSMRRKLPQEREKFCGLMHLYADKLATEMVRASEVKPAVPFTPEQIELFNKIKAINPTSTTLFTYDSYFDIAHKALLKMINELPPAVLGD